MTFYYSKSKPAFYTPGIHGDAIPEDAVPVTEEAHRALFKELSKGKILRSDERGYPIAVDPPPPTLEEWAENNLSRRQAMMNDAALKIAPLQDAVDLNIATDDEKQHLKKWKLYRVTLNRIEQQPGFPTQVDWPKVPEAA